MLPATTTLKNTRPLEISLKDGYFKAMRPEGCEFAILLRILLSSSILQIFHNIRCGEKTNTV